MLDKLAGQSFIQLPAGLADPRRFTAQSGDILSLRLKSFNKVV